MISLTENEFNNHSSVQMIETIYRNSSFQFKHINTKDVQDLFENLNPRKSCSDTGLMPKLMKKVAEGIAPSVWLWMAAMIAVAMQITTKRLIIHEAESTHKYHHKHPLESFRNP